MLFTYKGTSAGCTLRRAGFKLEVSHAGVSFKKSLAPVWVVRDRRQPLVTFSPVSFLIVVGPTEIFSVVWIRAYELSNCLGTFFNHDFLAFMDMLTTVIV